jgi:hypothetical protein
MTRRVLSFLAIFSLIVASSAFGKFLPDNDLHLQDNVNFTGGISEEEFNQVIDIVNEIYAPVVKSHRGKLKFKRKWKDSTVNASASQFWGTWTVNMYGGLARRPEVTVDGFTMVVCHELGHHLGGFPKSSGWAANEGQSDYFATFACARKLWGEQNELNAEARSEISKYPKKLCDDMYSNRNDQNFCYRQMLANFSIANLLGALKGDTVAFNTPDENVVSKTNNSHPAAQCRLDTYVAASLCKSEWDINVIPKTEVISAEYTCARKDGWDVGMRPHCWFKEKI